MPHLKRNFSILRFFILLCIMIRGIIKSESLYHTKTFHFTAPTQIPLLMSCKQTQKALQNFQHKTPSLEICPNENLKRTENAKATSCHARKTSQFKSYKNKKFILRRSRKRFQKKPWQQRKLAINHATRFSLFRVFRLFLQILKAIPNNLVRNYTIWKLKYARIKTLNCDNGWNLNEKLSGGKSYMAHQAVYSENRQSSQRE